MLKNLIESIKSKPKNKFSLENLQYLHGTLVRNPVINEQNKNLIIETLRQTAEVMIWGDQHNSEFFDFFLEKNILSFFLRILSQKTNRQVKVQLIQTLSILIENIRSQDSLYYILSNNHVNELITHKFDFSDDELMAYYISLLKTLSLKLNPNTVQFFFNSLENDFPLYTEAIKFFNHKDSMIRIAVRTLSLNVYKVEDEAMRRFVLDKTAAPYFLNIVWFIRDQCTTLDSLVANSTHTNRAKLEDFTAELMDYFYYLHDIFNLGIKELSEVLSDHLIKFLILPQFVGSLIQDDDGVVLEDRLSPLLAVFLLAQVFYVFSYKPLINTIAAALFHPKPSSYALPHLQNPISLLETRRMPSKRYSLSDLQKLEAEQLKARKQIEDKKNNTAPNTPTAPRKDDCTTLDSKTKTNKYHATLLSFLNNGDRMILVVMCVFYAVTKNQSIDPIMLEFSGLFPFRSYKAKRLLEELTEAKQKSTSENSKHLRSRSLNGIDKVTLSSSWVDNHPLSPEDSSFTSDQVSRKTRSKKNKEEIEVRFVETQLEHTKTQDDCQCYVTRVTKDFDISEEEAISLWNKFMGPLLENYEEETTVVENQNESLTNEESEETSSQEEAKSENVIISPLVLSTNVVSSGDGSLQESPRRKRATSEGSHSPKQLEVLHCKSEKEVTMAKLVEHLLRVLLQSNQCRLISLQMTTLLIKELVYSLDSEPNLTLVHFHIIEEAYKNTTNNLRACLSGSLGDIFLELFEHELRTFKQINFDSLIGDASSLLLPVSATPMSGIALSKRLPSGEAEKIQKAVQAFLVLRELKYTMLKQKDDRLPFREDPIPILKAKDVFTFPTEDSKSVIPSTMTVGPTKKKLQRYLILDSGIILIVEPDPRSATKGGTKSPQTSSNTILPVSGHICNTIPLQNIEMEVDKSDDSVLQLTSHPTTSRFIFDFESSVECQSAKQRLEKARNKVRANKMMQIDEMLKDSVPFPKL